TSADAPILDTSRAQAYRLRYPGGARDAEALAVDAIHHHVYLTSKSLSGASTVYRLPAAPDPAAVQQLTAIGWEQLSFTGTPGGPYAPIGQLTVTGAAMSDDGSLFVLRTYTDAFVWRVAGGDLRAALRTDPVRLALPPEPQGEGITIQGGSFLLDSEGVHCVVLEVAMPRSVLAPERSAPSTGPSSPSSRPSSPAPSQQGSSGAGFGVVVLILAAALAIFLGSRLRRKQQRRPEDTSWTG
ncbi:MAG: hypothetical protein WCB04_11550, partial [Mycobacteriales bacterium]